MKVVATDTHFSKMHFEKFTVSFCFFLCGKFLCENTKILRVHISVSIFLEAETKKTNKLLVDCRNKFSKIHKQTAE